MTMSNPGSPQTQAQLTQNSMSFEFDNSIIKLMAGVTSANSEKEMIESCINYLYHRLNLSGASFVPLNELKAIAPPLFIGEVGNPKLFKLDNYINLIEVRQECKHCADLESDGHCVLLEDGTRFQIRCFNLIIGGRKEGIINLYWPKGLELDPFQIELSSKVIELIEQKIQLMTMPSEKFIQEVIAKPFSPLHDLSDLIGKSINKMCSANQIERVFVYFPDGFFTKYEKAVQLFPNVNKEELQPERVHQIEDILNHNNFEVVKHLLIENQNFNPSGLLVINSKTDLGPSKVLEGNPFIIITGERNQLESVLSDIAMTTIFEQIGFVFNLERANLKSQGQTMIDERIRLSREIHDGISQTLAFLMIQMKRMWSFYSIKDETKFIEVYDDSYQTLSDTYSDLRDAIHDLRRSPKTDFIKTIQQIGDEFAERTGIFTDVELEPFPINRDAQFQLHLDRILQEALSNIRRHAKAKKVWITGKNLNNQYQIEIMDDGIGFNTESGDTNKRGHYGLTSMRERAKILGIDLSIQSIPDQGTKVILTL